MTSQTKNAAETPTMTLPANRVLFWPTTLPVSTTMSGPKALYLISLVTFAQLAT